MAGTAKDLAHLNEIEMEMYHYTQNHLHLIPYMTIREFAVQVHSSPSSILRFCRKLDYRGFTEFKASCKQELDQAQTRDESDDTTLLFKDFLMRAHTPSYQKKLREAACFLGSFDRIICMGDGASGSIAYYAAMYFTASGSNALYVDHRYMQALRHPANDAYVLFSVSGESEQIIELACQIHKNQRSCLAITSSAYSTLSKLSCCSLPYRSDYIYDMSNPRSAKSAEADVNPRTAGEAEGVSTQLPVVFLIETLASLLETMKK